MPKNPKSHKGRKKSKVLLSSDSPKPFCPSTMVRFDGSPNEYSTVWVCKMCTTCIVSEEAVKNHIERCKASTVVPVVVKKKEGPYICDICGKLFTRAVLLKKHKHDQ